MHKPGFATARLALLAVVALVLGGGSFAMAREHDHWVVGWATSPEPSDPALALAGQTVRQVVHLGLDGRRARVWLSNAYGRKPLHVGAAQLAGHDTGAAIVAGTSRPLTFGGAREVNIPAGALMVSDPVSLPSTRELAISLYLPESTHAATEHTFAMATSYLSAAGNFSDAVSFPPASSTTSWYFLAGVDVETTADARAVVAVGDSITDGYASTVDANHRWPDFLAARLARRGGAARPVVDEGIAGNGLLRDIAGDNVLARLDRDLLAPSGAGYVVLLAGLNDIGVPLAPKERAVSAAELIAGQQQLISRARAHGLQVIGATLLPFAGSELASPAAEAKRQLLNQWIRTSGAFDAVVDFDRVMQDPARPDQLRPSWDSGDHIHPNDAGYEAMANAVPLGLFD